jgi:hypothetical protein
MDNRQLAEWIERGIRDPIVVEVKTRIWPIEARPELPGIEEAKGSQCLEPEVFFLKQDPIGHQIPLGHLRVNIIGAAFVGKMGSAKEAWCLFRQTKYFNYWDDDLLLFSGSCGINPHLQRFMEIPWTIANTIWKQQLGLGVYPPRSALEIARLLIDSK